MAREQLGTTPSNPKDATTKGAVETTLGGVPTTVGKAVVTAADAAAARVAINESFINVLDYIPNPADTSTHKAGFQAAIDAAVAGAGHEIVIPTGDWYVEGLVIPKKATLLIRGHGSSAFAQRAPGFVSVPPGTRLIRTGNMPVFIGIGGVPPTVTSTTLTDNNVAAAPGAFSPSAFDLVRDVVIQDLTLENQNTSATTPLLDLRGATSLYFNRVVFYSESRTTPMVELRGVQDTHFTECKIQGGGTSLRIFDGTDTYFACNALWFNSCSFEYYGINGIVIGDSGSTHIQVPRLIRFSDHKMESWLQNSPATSAIDLRRANTVMFSKAYVAHMNTTAPIVKCDKVTGLYGDIGFFRQFSNDYAEPSARLEIGANTTLVNFDVFLHSGPDGSVNVVTQNNISDSLTNIRIHGISEKINGTTQADRFNKVSTNWQVSEGTCQYVFGRSGGFNHWSVGNPSIPSSDIQQFSISATSPTTGDSNQILRLRSYNHTTGTNPSTATYRDMALTGFLHLSSTSLGWVNFQNLVNPPAAPVGGFRLYASNGSLTVDGTPIVTTTGTQTLSNKTFSGATTFGTIELGNADTTLERTAAGQIAVEGNPVGIKVAVPASTTSAGQPGQWAVDAANSKYYVCTATNTWKRFPITFDTEPWT